MALKAGMGSGSGSDEGAPEIFAEINITPLTDVFLVLLIIFMVTSSVMSQMGVDVNLPAASQATSQAQPEGVIVSLLPTNQIRVNRQAVALNETGRFAGLLKEAFGQTTSRLVILEGDRAALLGSAIQVMDEARKAGAQQFAIATGPEAQLPKR
ncbi:MAG TPA: biopolymer transporter ExbD [Bdellovibrionota bacterium]|nr:biopolymer transporter ExbD [Bdellovibrionota bacterium]